MAVQQVPSMPNTTESFSREDIEEYVRSQGLELSKEIISNNMGALRTAAESGQRCKECKGREWCIELWPGRKTGILFYPAAKVIHNTFERCDKDIEVEWGQHAQELISGSRLPIRLKQKSFENFRVHGGNKVAYEKAREAVDNKKGLMLIGVSGIGKTHLAAAILNKRLEKGDKAIYVTVPELMDNIRKATLEGGDGELIKLVTQADLLLLDDLGVERTTDFALEKLFVIINSRYLEEKQTIITSNFPLSGLVERMGGAAGQRIVSRIAEMCEIVRIDDKDWRFRDA